jgi:HAD superfamily 5'-nucleotidase-like hydrolase
MTTRKKARKSAGRRKSPDQVLLQQDRFISRAQRVFTNRNLRLSGVAAIGFDLDHTLAHYDPIAVEKLAFEITKKKLVEKREYPREILRLKYNPEFVVRGLVVDKRRGNTLKMDHFKYVRRAYHGRRPLSGDERRKVYRSQHLRLSHPNYISVDTLFHLPEVYLYATLVDFFESRKQRSEIDYEALYGDVREMIDEAHGDGSIKKFIVAKPGQFVRRDPKLGVVLEEFRRSGKKLFLLTNSEYYYSDALLRHLLERRSDDRPWESYFDLLIFDSRKPAFFLEENRERLEAIPVSTRYPVPAYSGGHARFLQEKIGAHGDEILYFGDHTYGDILRSKKTLGWRTAMIVPEVEREIAVTQQVARDVAKLEELVQQHDQIELAKAEVERRLRRLLRAREEEARHDAAPREGTTGGSVPWTEPEAEERREKQIRQLRESMNGLDHRASSLAGEIRSHRRKIESSYNPYWGSVFREGNVVSRFGDQVRDFACLYTSRVSNFLRYPWNYFFQSPVTFMPHDL